MSSEYRLNRSSYFSTTLNIKSANKFIIETMTMTKDWSNHERLEFKDQIIGEIHLTPSKAFANTQNFDFNTELIFERCTITSFDAIAMVLGKKITFKDCKIGQFICHATYFSGGFELINSIVEKPSTFDCGVHNTDPNAFIIKGSTFHEYLDFFDVYFEGPVQITNNDFQKGTNINLYLTAGFGIKKGISFTIENNLGVLDIELKNSTPLYNPTP